MARILIFLCLSLFLLPSVLQASHPLGNNAMGVLIEKSSVFYAQETHGFIMDWLFEQNDLDLVLHVVLDPDFLKMASSSSMNTGQERLIGFLYIVALKSLQMGRTDDFLKIKQQITFLSELDKNELVSFQEFHR